MNLSKLSEAKLEAAIEKQEAVCSRYNSMFIDAGRGQERISEIRKMTDPLSIAYIKEIDKEQALWEERNYRLHYHGKLSPVKIRKG